MHRRIWSFGSEHYRAFLRSRGMAAGCALVLHIAFVLCLMLSLRRPPTPDSAATEPVLTMVSVQPRTAQPREAPPAITPHLISPPITLSNAPPTVSIEVPVQLSPGPSVSQPGGSPQGGGGGNEGQRPSAPPAIVHAVAAIYSTVSALAHESGTVIVRVQVDPHGTPGEVRVQQSSGFPRLDDSAMQAVRQYRFTASTGDGPPRQPWISIVVQFDLLPVPVPTSFATLDTVVAEQIAIARRTGADLPADGRPANDLVRELAQRLLNAFARYASQPAPAGPLAALRQRLALQGKLRSIAFLGFASPQFDCGTVSVTADPGTMRCEIFEVQQDGGMSYWLALVEGKHGRLRNVMIAAPAATPGERTREY